MNFETLKYKANHYVLILLTFVLPLERKLAPPLIILFCLTSIINHAPKKYFNPKILWLAALFFIYGLGIIYSGNKGLAWNSLTEKLSILVFPLAIYCSNLNIKKHLQSILNAFLVGCFVSGAISLSYSFFNFYTTKNVASFFYGNSSYFFRDAVFSS